LRHSVISDIRALWRWAECQSARMSEIKNVGLDLDGIVYFHM